MSTCLLKKLIGSASNESLPVYGEIKFKVIKSDNADNFIRFDCFTAEQVSEIEVKGGEGKVTAVSATSNKRKAFKLSAGEYNFSVVLKYDIQNISISNTIDFSSGPTGDIQVFMDYSLYINNIESLHYLKPLKSVDISCLKGVKDLLFTNGGEYLTGNISSILTNDLENIDIANGGVKLSVNMEDLLNSPNLIAFRVSGNYSPEVAYGITGDIADAGSHPSILSLILNFTDVSGTIESFVKNAVIQGRTDTIDIAGIQSGITFHGTAISSKYFIYFEAPGAVVKVGGNTVGTYNSSNDSWSY